jgi:hypothetical protein
MKKKSSLRPLKTKTPVQTIPKSVGSKLGMLLGVIIPIAALVAYSMNISFFFITRIISIIVLIISVAAYIKGEVLYTHPNVVSHGNTVGSKKVVTHKKYNTNFSFSLKKGTVQVVLSMLIIILVTYLGQVIYNAIG